MNIVLIENGKLPDAPYNASLGFWLPPNTPYGNLTLKLMKLSDRLDEANRRLQESGMLWTAAISNAPNPPNASQRHDYANEQAIYLIRRAADEIISLIWCLSTKNITGQYPEQIKIDCVGAVLAQEDYNRAIPFRNHLDLFQNLNEIANAFKHSFIQSDLMIIGRDEPSVYALSLDRNRLSAVANLHGISLRALVLLFNVFYKDAMAWLRDYSEKNRNRG